MGDVVEIPETELEDIFPEKIYLEAVREAYALPALSVGKTDSTSRGITKRLKVYFEQHGLGQFEKWKPAGILRDWILAKPDRVGGKPFDTAEAIFRVVNEAFTELTSAGVETAVSRPPGSTKGR